MVAAAPEALRIPPIWVAAVRMAVVAIAYGPLDRAVRRVAYLVVRERVVVLLNAPDQA